MVILKMNLSYKKHNRKLVLLICLLITFSISFAQQKQIPKFEVISWNEQPRR